MKVIDKFQGEYRFLSNFYPCTIHYEDKVWPSAEHAYQAAKTRDTVMQEKIRHAKTPGEAKRLGQQVTMVTNWEDIKLDVMGVIVYLKFSQNLELGRKLLTTYPSTLVEGNHWNDTYWGVCRGVGTNYLGRILMRVRERLS